MPTNAIPDLSTIVAKLERRVYQLEQGRSLTYVGDGSSGIPTFPNGVSVGPVGSEVPVTVDPPGAPTNLSVSTGTFFDDIFIDSSWDPPVDPSGTASYEVELTKVGSGVARFMRVVSTACRFEPVEANTAYEVRVAAVSHLGLQGPFTGPQAISTTEDATLPAAPTGLLATSGITSVFLRWSDNAELDVHEGHGYYQVQIDTANTFSTGNLRTIQTSSTVTAFADLVTGTTYYFRVRAVDSSGNVSPYSSIVSEVPDEVGTTDIANLAITTAKIGSLAVTAAKIANATITSAQIALATIVDANIANATITSAKIISLTADKIATGTLNAGIVTIDSAGMLRMGRTSAPFHYQIIDSAGIRFYQSGTAAFTGGTLITDLNIGTGTAYFKGQLDALTGTLGNLTITGTLTMGTGGVFRTAASGLRLEISTVNANQIWFYSANVSETSPGRIEMSNVGVLHLIGADFSDGTNLTGEISIEPAASTSRLLLNAKGAVVVGNDTTGGRNLSLGMLTGYCDGQYMFHLLNTTAAPSTSPTGGAVIWAQGGALRMRSSAGDMTPIGPHRIFENAASGSLILGTSSATVPGCTRTFTTYVPNAVVSASALLDLDVQATGYTSLDCLLQLNGGTEYMVAAKVDDTRTGRNIFGTRIKNWLITDPGSNTIALRGKKTAGGGTVVFGANCILEIRVNG